MASYDDDYDSDDSGFGFDDGLSTDEVLLGRIAKMRSMMTLTTDEPSTKTAPAPVKEPPAPVQETPTLEKETSSPVKETPAPMTEMSSPVHVDVPSIATMEQEKSPIVKSEEDDFLLVDRVQTLSLSETQPETPTVETPPVTNGMAGADKDELGAEDDEEEDDDDDEYEVTWAHGQLGLLFKAGSHGETIIRRINKKVSSAEGLHIARVGDVLVAINGVSVRGRAFSEINEQLRLPDFPVKLSFQPLKVLDDDDEHDIATRDPTTRSSDQEMSRKESSVSIISSTSSANGPYAPLAPMGPNGNALGPAASVGMDQLNQFPPPLGVPPPAYSYSQSFDDEYDVVWRQGSLGCGIKQRNGLPTVKSVKPGAASDPSIQQIATGDVMIAINGKETETIGFRAVVEIMQHAPKPLYMRFRRAGAATLPPPPLPPPYVQLPPPYSPPRPSRYESNDFENLRESRVDMEEIIAGSLTPQQYTVLWKDGPLGVQIKPRSSDGVVIVTKFTGTGNPELLSAISIGDVFVRIAGLNVADLGISGTFEKLKTVHKPVPLVFERASSPEPTPQAPPPPPPQSAPSGARQGFSADDLHDSTVVPSFRELREREAAANQGRYRDSFSGFSAEQRAEEAFGATGRRAMLALQRPASYDKFESGPGNEDGLQARHSFPQAESSSAEGRYQDRVSDPAQRSGEHSGGSGDPAPGVTDSLPRFSDIEMGRVKTTTLSSLPPPPAYNETFTPSGRFLDPNQFVDAAQPPSPPADGPRGTGVSSGQGRFSGPQGPPPAYIQAVPPSYAQAPPPAYGQGHGYTLPTPPPGARKAPSYNMPTPPSYDQHANNYNKRSGDDNSMRIDYMRQQYIESERMRNQPLYRDGAMTEISTYSDLDDSGIMAAMRRPADRMRMQASPNHGPPARQSLPAPELWILWSEGPLGITFRRTNGQIVVSRLTGAGYSQGIEQLRAGDWLVSFGNPSVGTYNTTDLRLSETMDLIKSLPKPVDMRFIVR